MKKIILAFIAVPFMFSCQQSGKTTIASNTDTINTNADTLKASVQQVTLPQPFATPSVRKMSKVIGWPKDKMPQAPAGFIVNKFADSLDNPRWIYVADNGDIFVAESNNDNSANRITLFRDTNNDGVPETRSVFLKGLNSPFGMYAKGNSFYVANTDGLMQYAYTPGNTEITHPGKQIVDLPGGPRHWTRNVIGNADGSKLYIAIGSSSNVGENGLDKETRRAMILQVNANGTGEKIYASGLRNPVGMAWAPGTQTLWTAVNERDELGDDLVPDYLTSVKDGGFYGWPYSYFGQHQDPRLKDTPRLDLVKQAIVPDYSLGAHTASLGLAFYKGNFPQKYNGGAFIGQHGSWNRSTFTGYKVVFVPFANGKPAGPSEDFLTGFIADENKNEVYGRPVGVAVLKDGSLLVADDGGRKLWRVTRQ
jgi:glucose/arabinose dehydrogenase